MKVSLIKYKRRLELNLVTSDHETDMLPLHYFAYECVQTKGFEPLSHYRHLDLNEICLPIPACLPWIECTYSLTFSPSRPGLRAGGREFYWGIM